MSVSHLAYMPQLNPVVGSITATAAPSSLSATSFNNQNVTGVKSISGGDASGVTITATTGPLHLVQPASRFGTVVAVNDTAVVQNTTAITANSVVLLTVKTTAGADAGQAVVSAVVAGTSFTIKSGVDDQSTYNYMIIDTA